MEAPLQHYNIALKLEVVADDHFRRVRDFGAEKADCAAILTVPGDNA